MFNDMRLSKDAMDEFRRAGACCTAFQTFYHQKHNGRKVSWQASMGNADICATFSGGRKHDLQVHTYSVCILMLFNERDSLSYEDIHKATQIPENELRRNLISISTNKHRILRKTTKGKG
eukprot:evm.model.NODE_4175_length_6537_cov_28.057673.4